MLPFQPKRFLVIIFVVYNVSLFGLHKIYNYHSNEKQKKIDSLSSIVSECDVLRERKSRLEFMEKTLMIHYKLTPYESHYYSIVFDDFSQKYNIPWYIYPAILRIESNFDPTLKSHKGARGIAQVIEPTGKEMARKLGIPYKKGKTLWNDILNMTIGFEYLSQAIIEKGLEDGIKVYIGGHGFDKSRKDIGRYSTTVRWEYDRLRYIHAGVITGQIKKDVELDSLSKDTIRLAKVD